jgi:hypothetical protein
LRVLKMNFKLHYKKGALLQALVIISVLLGSNLVLANGSAWVTSWGAAGDDVGNGIALGSDNSIYCVGYSWNGINNDLVILKLNPDKSLNWSRSWDTGSHEAGYGVALDANGDIYCAGKTNGLGAGFDDILIIKYFPNGTEAWNSTLGKAQYDKGFALTIDSSGTIYCTGSAKFGGSNDLIIAKFESLNGTEIANATTGGTSDDIGYGVAVNTSGDGSIYCVGYSYVSNSEFYIVKFQNNLSVSWEKIWGTGIGESDKLFDVAIHDDFIYVTGETCVGSIRDFFAAKFHANGTAIWNLTWGEANRHESGMGLTINGSYLYCTGYISSDLAVFKLSLDGELIWYHTWEGDKNDFGHEIAIDANGIYCIGKTTSLGADGTDLLVVKFLADGTGPSTGGGIPGFVLPAVIFALSILVVMAISLHWRKPRKISQIF